jgi:hypothetical protein
LTRRARTQRAIIIPFQAWAAMPVVQAGVMEGSGEEEVTASMIDY